MFENDRYSQESIEIRSTTRNRSRRLDNIFYGCPGKKIYNYFVKPCRCGLGVQRFRENYGAGNECKWFFFHPRRYDPEVVDSSTGAHYHNLEASVGVRSRQILSPGNRIIGCISFSKNLIIGTGNRCYTELDSSRNFEARVLLKLCRLSGYII